MILTFMVSALRHVHSYPKDELLFEPSKFVGRMLTEWSEAEHFGNPEEQGPYFEGDIILPIGRAFFTRQARKWDDGVIPFEISGSFSKFILNCVVLLTNRIIHNFTAKKHRAMILTAIKEIESKTCIKLVPHSTEDDFIIFNNDESGCWSKVGSIGGPQTINLQKPCFNVIGTIIHEILHAVGLFHEQNRSDRDEFIGIVTKNIRKKSLVNFNKFKPNIYDAEDLLYDYQSVLHYSPYAFSINGQPTIETKGSPETVNLMGQRKGLSEGDIMKVNMMYNCPT